MLRHQTREETMKITGTKKRYKLLVNDGEKTHYKEFDDRYKAANLVAMMLDLLTTGDKITIEVEDVHQSGAGFSSQP
jgi:hypothetical protein